MSPFLANRLRFLPLDSEPIKVTKIHVRQYGLATGKVIVVRKGN